MSNSESLTPSPETDALQARIDELEVQLLQAQKLGSVGELASSITHEFNNILTTVINYAKLGLRHKDATSRDKAFDKILSASQRAAKITTGLLSYARARETRQESTSLTRVVQDVLVLVEKDLQIHRIRVELKMAGDPHARINAGEIQQVLLNLLVNARQAMQPGGTITISVTEDAEHQWAEVSVKDTGSGIPAEKLPQIFTRFYSTKSADQNGQGGNGLGLALCKKIMDSHQGRIRVESAPGYGTKFTLKFPTAVPPNLLAACGLPESSAKVEREAKVQSTTV
ncbi:sensor histidine kinase [Planctomicrobium piriforme]|uniref:histidine kinase n=1 Tax=Planctomicrobium piriforme TaxID=1576369 RepID=A0A1I3GPV1_9PLAN|nr:ATP-binding protein [Planctomicrobium piriforme]SFI25371.1 His Kinase A (phospho-acceptor) domain-containing protein [Planctomicrobium piriforme]